jgi:Protein of unknown function (DUF2849)
VTSPHEQKLKVKGNVVVTANRLTDGTVIYRTAEGDWTTDLRSAVIVNTASAATELLQASAADGVRAVGPYVAPVAVTSDRHVLPGNLRERIRAAGPTITLPGVAA